MLKTKVINYSTHEVYTAELASLANQQAECLIGRHPNCDLVLDGPTVSRVHGRFVFQSGQCFFVDLGSADGSRLNNEEIYMNQAYAIAPDDVIRIGEFALVVEAVAPVAEVLPANNLWLNKEITVRCVQIVQETHDVKTFRFVAEPELLFNFKPGQFVTIQLPVRDAVKDAVKSAVKNAAHTEQPVMRSYSISSSPSRPYTLDITVKRVGAARDDLPPGRVSNWLHDQLQVGATLQMQGPFGAFNCVDQPADKLLLISAGSGITPMMSMAQWLSDRATNTEITFIHAARTPQDIIFRQRLALLAAQHPHFKLAFTITQHTPNVAWAGYQGRLNLAMLSAICPDFEERTAFVCGPAGFMRSTKTLLTTAGFPMNQYFEESFGGPSAPQTAQPPKISASPASPSIQPPHVHSQPASKFMGNPVVEFSASGKQIACDPSDTLLEAAEQAGISIASGCRRGSCGACKQLLVAGNVCYEQEPRGLSEGDRAAGKVLACVAKPIGRVVLSL
jgi:glycine betaine catabolism B